MTSNSFMSRYWRVPVVALLAAVVAFGASYAVKKSYTSNTRLLIVEGSTTLLSSSGQPISSQPSVNSPALAQTLAQTQAGLASSRQVATIVVNQLHLDQQKPSHGVIHAIEGAAASVYAHLKGWIESGTYATLPKREKAIQETEAAIKAADLAPSSGPDTGQNDSYILELSASGDSARQAQQIADAAADALISVSQQRFQHDSQQYVKALQAQLNNATAQLTADSEAVSNYEVANNISAVDQQIVLNLQSQGSIQSQIVSAKAAVQGDQEEVSSLQASLAATPSTVTSSQDITTGRSTTSDATTQTNPVYQTIQNQLSQAQANLAADNAKLSTLQGEASANPSSNLTNAQAHLLTLEQQVTADQNAVQALSGSLQEAQANVQVSPADLSRLGPADLPTYPSSPKRYLYLLLGLLIGALAGGGLTYRAIGRTVPADPADGPDGSGPGHELRPGEPTAIIETDPTLVGAGARTNGDGWHAATSEGAKAGDEPALAGADPHGEP